VATETLLADFLREIRDVSIVRKRYEEQAKSKRRELAEYTRRPNNAAEKLPDITLPYQERNAFIPENNAGSDYDRNPVVQDDHVSEADYRDTGSEAYHLWINCR